MTNRFARWLHREPVRPEEYVGNDEARNEELVQTSFTSKAKRCLRFLPMASEVVALYFCLFDARTPLWVKTTVAAALAYFIMPVDAIPDFLPIIGLSDDAGVLTAAITAVAAHITPEHRERAVQWMAEEHVIDVTPREQPVGS
jgi:uncharacterized membrane protein YkvA (DUF1232 family)